MKLSGTLNQQTRRWTSNSDFHSLLFFPPETSTCWWRTVCVLSGDTYQTVACNLEALQQLRRLPPQRGRKNQLAGA